jgi:hypothetical protein
LWQSPRRADVEEHRTTLRRRDTAGDGETGLPEIDDELRLRLARRFGSAIDPWLDSLPGVLAELAERWELEWDALIRVGACRRRSLPGRRPPAVLKASPDRGRIVHEAAAIARWQTAHVRRYWRSTSGPARC